MGFKMLQRIYTTETVLTNQTTTFLCPTLLGWSFLRLHGVVVGWPYSGGVYEVAICEQ